MTHARAILWAQWKTIRNYLPRASKGGLVFTIIIGAIWYGFFAFLAALLGSSAADSDALPSFARLFPSLLLLLMLYWQVIPILMVSVGSSLDLKKLLVYPIPTTQLFAIEVLLRVTTGLEALVVLAGVAAGLWINPDIQSWAPLWLLPFVLLNLFLSAGVRDLLGRLLARKRVRELVVFLFVMAAALPQLLVLTGAPDRVKHWFSGEPAFFLPWTAASSLILGPFKWTNAAILVGWTAAAYLFGRWQFARTLTFDAAASQATFHPSRKRSHRLEAFYRLPSAFLPDPLGALIEKEARTLIRSPRFRLVFVMGFSFGLLIWLPITFGRNHSPNSLMSGNYLTFVSLYALLLLSDTLFWNTFGFDRSAAQVYFLVPVKISTALVGKNLTAMFFVLVEIGAIALVCALLRLPLSTINVLEAFGVTVVVALFLLAVGNLSSFYNPRPVNPAKSVRTAASGRAQAVMMLTFPFALAPVLLAYAARYAFATEFAFFGVLLVAAIFGVVVYRISMDSAVQAAEQRKEQIITALSRGEGPIES